MDDLDSLVQEKIEADTEFQASIAELEDFEREEAIETKRKEVLSNEFKTLKEQAEEAAKAKELAENYKIRAEKAEKVGKASPSKSEESGLDTSDLLYLAKADIHEDDMSEVLEYAKFKKVPVKEAHNLMKDMLSIRAEQRKTALATQTGQQPRSGVKVDGAQLLQNASKGKLPEDEAGIEALVAAELAQKQARK